MTRIRSLEAEISVGADDDPPGVLTVRVAGDITHRADLPKLLTLEPTELRFDFSHLRRFDSRGVALWLRTVTALREAGFRATLHNVPPVFLNQVQSITGFTAGWPIVSLAMAYYCEVCESATYVSLSRDDDFPDGELRRRTVPCSACGQDAFVDDSIAAVLTSPPI